MHSYLGDRHYSFISAACVHLAGTLTMAVPFQKKKNQPSRVDAPCALKTRKNIHASLAHDPY